MSSGLLRRGISALTLTAFIAALVAYAIRNPDQFAVLWHVSAPSLVVLALGAATIIVLNGLYVRVVCQAFGVHLGAPEWLSLSVVTSAANFLTPMRGGAVLRAAYLKRRHDFAFTDSATTLAAMFLISSALHGSLGLAATLAIAGPDAGDLRWSALTFGGVAAGASLAMLLSPLIPTLEGPLLGRVARVLDGWRRVRSDRTLLAELSLLTAVYVLVSWGIVWVGLLAVGANVGPWDAALVAAAQGLGLLATITPGGLGVAETLSVVVGRLVNVTPAQAVIQLALVRVLIWGWLGALTVPALHQLGLGSLWRASADPKE